MKSTCWGTRATDWIIKSGQKDTEASTPIGISQFGFNMVTENIKRKSAKNIFIYGI